MLAKVRAKQKELDVAELEVVGGEGEPVPLAPPLEPKETDDVTVPGCCEGTIRSVARTRLGVPHFEVAFDRLPKPGSVVIDAQGRAVGLTTDETLVQPFEVAPLEERAKAAVAQEVSALRRALQQPVLAAALVDANGALHAVLLSRTKVDEVKLEGGCTVSPSWEPFRMTAWFDAAERELFQFIDKHDLDIGLFMSTVAVTCGGGGATELKLEGAAGQIEVSKTDQVMTATAKEGAPPPKPLPRPPAKALTSADEQLWRSRYRALRDGREQLERTLREKQRFIDDADTATRRRGMRDGYPPLTPDERVRYDQYRRDLEQAEEQRAVFRRMEDDLEREASSVSVPREWRR
ncbi:MAG: trypsin-like peptidase domain-containing protein [Myxococcaceae bacterium]|nr:trypsin-like peptidase domain-containing protein [Myxococcaceae bacterium]